MIETYVTQDLNVKGREKKLDEACRTFFNWKDSVNETWEEYENRVKKAKILRVMKDIINNELSEKEKKILTLKYAGHKSCTEIAEEVSLSPSAISRAVKRIEYTIKNNLKYALIYAEMDVRNEVTPIAVSEAIETMTLCAVQPDTLGERLKKARKLRCLSVEKVAAANEISLERYKNIEAGGKISLKETVKLALFFSLSADYLIFGV